jgi:hypothetical protein
MEMIFNLFKRKGKRGNYIYYVRFWNSETNKIIKTLSSGKFTIKDASRWALEQIQEYNFLKAKSIPTFQSYTENWFVWDECTFIEKQLAKGKRFSRSHADGRRGILKNHLLPYFGNKKLTDIRVIDIENFMTKMSIGKNHEFNYLILLLSQIEVLVFIILLFPHSFFQNCP